MNSLAGCSTFPIPHSWRLQLLGSTMTQLCAIFMSRNRCHMALQKNCGIWLYLPMISSNFILIKVLTWALFCKPLHNTRNFNHILNAREPRYATRNSFSFLGTMAMSIQFLSLWVFQSKQQTLLSGSILLQHIHIPIQKFPQPFFLKCMKKNR